MTDGDDGGRVDLAAGRGVAGAVLVAEAGQATEEFLPPGSAVGNAVGIRYGCRGFDAEGLEEGVKSDWLTGSDPSPKKRKKR